MGILPALFPERVSEGWAENMAEYVDDSGTKARLKVIGIGGGGGNAINRMISSNLEGVSYEELQEGQRVSYTEGQGPKGPRAENVKLV